MTLVNTKLLAHPLNWLTLWSMALVVFFVGHLLISYFNGTHPGLTVTATGAGTVGPGTADTTSSATNN